MNHYGYASWDEFRQFAPVIRYICTNQKSILLKVNQSYSSKILNPLLWYELKEWSCICAPSHASVATILTVDPLWLTISRWVNNARYDVKLQVLRIHHSYPEVLVVWVKSPVVRHSPKIFCASKNEIQGFSIYKRCWHKIGLSSLQSRVFLL